MATSEGSQRKNIWKTVTSKDSMLIDVVDGLCYEEEKSANTSPREHKDSGPKVQWGGQSSEDQKNLSRVPQNMYSLDNAWWEDTRTSYHL